MTPRFIETPEQLKSLEGQEIAVGDWLEITQDRVNQFADATDDHNWIHVDVERAKRESPYGTTVAHGLLTVSLNGYFMKAVKLPWSRMGVYYGMNKIRFPAPVPVGSRVRGHIVPAEVTDFEGGVQIVWRITVEREGGDKPVAIVETISRQHF
jgi:acyl dehydratase